jgi:hypothetical protein
VNNIIIRGQGMSVAKFSVAARTLVHLGAELITSDEVALNELIKNAFDAESERVKISFHIPVSQVVILHAEAAVRSARTSAEIKAAIIALRAEIETAADSLPEGLERGALLAKLSAIESTTSKERLLEQIEEINYLTVEDSGSGMSETALEAVFLRIGTDSRFQEPRAQNTGQQRDRPSGNDASG